MPVQIAIPVPTSTDLEYNGRCLPMYVKALEAAGAEAVIVPLSEPQAQVAKLLAGVQGILLPGSLHDVDPQRYGEEAIPECGEADAARTAVDELMLQDAFNLKKPILGICHGTQTLNVWRNGSLIQDLKTVVNHSPGREVVKAHPVNIAEGSRLAALLAESGETLTGGTLTGSAGSAVVAQVNSSHHQAVRVPGDNLLVSAVSAGDGVIEAVELDTPEHFVVAVQWHPERTYAESAFSRAIFAAFTEAAETWHPPQVEASVAQA
jgi:putative glutamine amidotransferase